MSIAHIAPSASLKAKTIEIGVGTVIAEGVDIAAEEIRIGENCYLGANVRIMARTVDLGYNCILFDGCRILSLDGLRMGAYAKLSSGTTLKAGNINVGIEFWMNAGAEIGGGGWRNADSAFLAGDRCHVGRNTHINVAYPVSFGHDTAVGMDCTLATHAHWQPITEGYPVYSGPVTLGSNVAVYTRSIISPGVTVGNGSAIAAGSVVTRDVGEHVFVGGAPAHVIREGIGRGADPAATNRRLCGLIERRFAKTMTAHDGRYLLSLDTGQTIRITDRLDDLDDLDLEHALIISSNPEVPHASANRAECTFDLYRRELSGRSSATSEALRNVFFSLGVRFTYLGYRRNDLSYTELIELGIE